MTGQDEIAADAMHKEAMELYFRHLVSPAGASEEFQQGLMTGMIFAVSSLLWLGRREGHSAAQIADKIREIAFDALKQNEDRERATHN